MAPLTLNIVTRWSEWSHSRPDTHCILRCIVPHDWSERLEGERAGTPDTQLSSVEEDGEEGDDFGSRKPISQFVVCFVADSIA